MAYKVSMRNSFSKDYKRLSADLQQAVMDSSEVIERDPSCGKPMSNNLSGLTKFSFGRKPELRILYVVYDCRFIRGKEYDCRYGEEIPHEGDELLTCNGLIEYVYVKTREECNNLYSQRKKHFKNLFRG
jgi:mRNA-degrading endonuclease RelE of RelBE toxin-antitoxin system